jgi:hypothetical protein
MNLGVKILNKIMVKILQHIENIMHYDQVCFIPGMLGMI